MDSTTDGTQVASAGSNGNGHRSVSMADVAAAAGVSQQTVSRVVNGQPNVSKKTRDRVERAIAELGFRPSFAGRSLRLGRYRTVGLCTFDISMAGNLSMFEGVVIAAREQGYAVTMIEMGPEQAPYRVSRATQRLAELPVDGAIINLSILPDDFEEYTPLPGLSTVLVTMYAHPRCTTVDSDQYGCALLAMDHLMKHGHRQIRFIAGPSYSSHSAFREAGWADVLRNEGIEAVVPLEGDWSADSGYEAGAKLAQDRDMTAIFAANDQMALGAIAALRDAGRRVPEDVSVIGVDDFLEGVVPHNDLTTVRFDKLERGRVLFERAIQGGPSTAIRIPGQLIERGTVADRR